MRKTPKFGFVLAFSCTQEVMPIQYQIKRAHFSDRNQKKFMPCVRIHH
jgi:hypothetical protein